MGRFLGAIMLPLAAMLSGAIPNDDFRMPPCSRDFFYPRWSRLFF
jgi:hypothetical protein